MSRSAVPPTQRPGTASGRGDQRRAVGQARLAVEAVVLDAGADGLHALGAGARARLRGRLARQEVSLVKPSASTGAQVGTASAICRPS